jgi:hypothetical protein
MNRDIVLLNVPNLDAMQQYPTMALEKIALSKEETEDVDKEKNVWYNLGTK